VEAQPLRLGVGVRVVTNGFFQKPSSATAVVGEICFRHPGMAWLREISRAI